MIEVFVDTVGEVGVDEGLGVREKIEFIEFELKKKKYINYMQNEQGLNLVLLP